MLLDIRDGKINESGHFVGTAVVTGVGVLDYTKEFGLHLLRPEDEVFDQASLDSAKMIPVTLGHPAQDMDSDTIKKNAIGWTGETIKRIGNSVAISFKIVDAWVVQQMKKIMDAGKRIQFSMGAKAFPDIQKGDFGGKTYDGILRRIKYDHLAMLLIEDGRYPYTGLLEDALKTNDGYLFLMDGKFKSEESKKMKIKLPNGVEIEVSDSDGRYLENHLTEHEGLKTQLATKTGELTQAQKQLNDAKSQILDSKAMDEKITSRLALVLEAQTLLDSINPQDLAEKTDQEIYEAVAIADGYTDTELAEMKTSLNDSYPATLAGIYSQIKRVRGEKTSENINNAAGRASGATRKNEGIEIKDSFDASKKKLEKSMEEARTGVKVNAN